MNDPIFLLKNLTLSKRQIAMVSELMCPNCREELSQLSKTSYHCTHCGIHFIGEHSAGAGV